MDILRRKKTKRKEVQRPKGRVTFVYYQPINCTKSESMAIKVQGSGLLEVFNDFNDILLNEKHI